MARRHDPNDFMELFGSVRHAMSGVATQVYATIGLGATQAKFLRYIGQQSRVSQADVARATATDPTLTGRVLATLIERGLVRRQRSEEDRREYVLELEAEGKRLRARVEKLRAQVLGRVVDALDDRDLEDFDRIANKIIAALNDAPE